MLPLSWEGKRFPSEVGEEQREPGSFKGKMLLHPCKLNGTVEALSRNFGLFRAEAVCGLVAE